MALPSVKNRVGMTVTGTPGTGTITLNAAESGYQSFASAYGANANVDILIEEGTSWEIARDCTYTHSGTTVTRGTLEASSSGSAVSFTSAAKVYVINSANRIEANERQVDHGFVLVQNNGSTTQSFASSTATKVTTVFATETADPNGWWDATNKKFIPTRAGKYEITTTMCFDSVADGKEILFDIYKNGSFHFRICRLSTGGASQYPQPSGTTVVSMNGSTDYIEVYVLHTDSVARSNYPQAEINWFQARFIGD